MSANDIPCRVTADLNRHLRLQEQADQRKFDPMDGALMHDLFGKRLAVPIASLLIAWEQVQDTEQSFGADRDKVFDFLRPHLAALKDACEEEFRQL
jgi:hypothetical protein